MKFRTRLLVTSVFIVVAPLLLTAIAFSIIGIYMINSEREFGAFDQNYTSFAYTLENYNQMTADVLLEVREQLEEDPSRMEDVDYLEEINDQLANKSSYIIVRKGQEIYYAGDEKAAERIFLKLPEYGRDFSNIETGYYYNDMRKLVKQLDFLFRDGAEGSLFIVTRVSSLISQKMLIDMVLAFILILIFTSMVLTNWIQRGEDTDHCGKRVCGRHYGQGSRYA